MAETPYGLRERATQFVAWLMGPLMHQRQQQVFETERQQSDGTTRGGDDPDNRRPMELTEHLRQYGQRQTSDDGPDDVRRHEELGPRSGSREAAQIENAFENNRAREERREAQEDALRTGIEAALQRREDQRSNDHQHGWGR